MALNLPQRMLCFLVLILQRVLLLIACKSLLLFQVSLFPKIFCLSLRVPSSPVQISHVPFFVSETPGRAIMRVIEWSLRAFANMRVVRLFLRARAVINFLMRAASTFSLEITNGEQRALCFFSVESLFY